MTKPTAHPNKYVAVPSRNYKIKLFSGYDSYYTRSVLFSSIRPNTHNHAILCTDLLETLVALPQNRHTTEISKHSATRYRERHNTAPHEHRKTVAKALPTVYRTKSAHPHHVTKYCVTNYPLSTIFRIEISIRLSGIVRHHHFKNNPTDLDGKQRNSLKKENRYNSFPMTQYLPR